MKNKKPKIDFKRMSKLKKKEVSNRINKNFKGLVTDVYLIGFKDGMVYKKNEN